MRRVLRRTTPLRIGVVASLAGICIAIFLGLRGGGEEGSREHGSRPAGVQGANEHVAPVLRGTSASARTSVGSRDAPPALQERDSRAVLRFRGRVVAADFEPAAGASIAATRGGSLIAAAATDQRGEFDIAIPTPARPIDFLVQATLADSSLAVAEARAHPGSAPVTNVGTLVLGRARALEVRVSRRGAAAAGVSVWLAVTPTGTGIPWESPQLTRPWIDFYASSRTNEMGVATFERVPAGSALIVATDGRDSRGEAIQPEGSLGVVEIELQSARQLQIDVRDQRGNPLPACSLVVYAGADRLLDPWLAVTTDAEGRALLGPLPTGIDLSLDLIHDDFVWPGGPGHAETRVPRAGSTMEIRVPIADVVLVPVAVRDGEPLADSATVAILRSPGDPAGGSFLNLPATAVVEHGFLRVHVRNRAWLRGVVKTADGRTGVIELQPDFGDPGHRFLPPRAVVLTRGRVLDITVLSSSGGPADGVAVVVRLRNGDLLATVTTDERGAARVEGLPPTQVKVTVAANSALTDSSRWGVFAKSQDVDLDAADRRIDFVVPDEQEAVIRVRVNGVARIPPATTFDARVLPEGDSYRPLPSPQFDATRGEVRFRVRMPTDVASGGPPAVHVRVTAPEHAIHEATLVRAEAGTVWGATIELEPACAMRTSLVGWEPALGFPTLEQRRLGRWNRVPRGPDVTSASPSTWTFRRLPPGEYRLSCEHAGISSASVRVVPERTTELRWDLSGRGWVEGVVALPESADPKQLELYVDGVPHRELEGTLILDGTAFRLRVSGDHPVHLAARHPACSDEGVASSVIVTTPRDDVVLTLTPR